MVLYTRTKSGRGFKLKAGKIEEKMPCGVCGEVGHNRTTCPQGSGVLAAGRCDVCGADGLRGKFCSDCGAPLSVRAVNKPLPSSSARPSEFANPADRGRATGALPSSSARPSEFANLAHRRRATGALRSLADGEMRWTYAAALEADALTEFKRNRHVSNPKMWAKFKHATYIVLHRNRNEHNGGQIRTWRDAMSVHGVGGKTAEFLQNKFSSSNKKAKSFLPGGAEGPFPTTSEAILVALLKWRRKHGEHTFCPWHVMRDNARELFKNPFLNTASTSPETVFPDFQVGKRTACWKTCYTLTTGGVAGAHLVEERSQNKSQVFRLTHPGFVMAELVCKRARDCFLASTSSSSSRHPQGKLIKHYHNGAAPNSDGLVLFVDHREGGGESRSLNHVYRKLKALGLRIEVRSLHDALHDYCFVWRCHEGERPVDYLLPCLIERKAKVDIVDSMTDGRWDRQKAQIQAVARKLWPPGSRSSSKICPRSVYILEGDENILGPGAYNEVYNCECLRKCGGLYGGCVSRGVPTAMHVRQKLLDLVHEVGPYMHVEVTKDGIHTGLYLSRIATILSNEVARNGGSPSRAGGVKMNDQLYETLKLLSPPDTRKIVRIFSLGTRNSDPGAKVKWYQPRRQGSNYAILICLLINEQGMPGGTAPLEGASLTKDELLEQGDSNFGDNERRLCDKGMRCNHRRNTPFVYDGFAGVSKLLDVASNTRSRYLKKSGGRNNARIHYSLTAEGRRIAELCHRDAHFHNHCGCGRDPKGGKADWIALYTQKDLKRLCKDVQISSSGSSTAMVQRLEVKWSEIEQKERLRHRKSRSLPHVSGVREEEREISVINDSSDDDLGLDDDLFGSEEGLRQEMLQNTKKKPAEAAARFVAEKPASSLPLSVSSKGSPRKEVPRCMPSSSPDFDFSDDEVANELLRDPFELEESSAAASSAAQRPSSLDSHLDEAGEYVISLDSEEESAEGARKKRKREAQVERTAKKNRTDTSFSTSAAISGVCPRDHADVDVIDLT
eukprot:g3196.t1